MDATTIVVLRTWEVFNPKGLLSHKVLRSAGCRQLLDALHIISYFWQMYTLNLGPIVLLLAALLGGNGYGAHPLLSEILAGGLTPVERALPGMSDACLGVQPIAEARGRGPGAEVTVLGSITVPTGVLTANQSFALQDDTGGIYVYGRGAAAQPLDLGDRVCVSGRLALYHGLLEIAPEVVTRVGRGDPPPPRTIEPTHLGDATEGLLVSITGSASGVEENPFHVGGAAVYLDRDTGTSAKELVEGCPVTVVGLGADYDGPQLWPRSQEDIVPRECVAARCADFTIAQIQGQGAASPYAGQTGLSCLAGCVTGVASDGFYLQSTTPDTDPLTSEGVYVYRYDGWANPQSLTTGDLVEVRGFDVEEFYGSTEITGLDDDSRASYRRVGSCALPDPVSIAALTDPQTDPGSVYEPVENMRVALSFDGAVVGPTTRYPGRFPGGEAEIALIDRRSPLAGQRIFAGELAPGHGMVYLSGALGRDLPDAGAGDRLSGSDVTGILAYQFERYILLVDACPTCGTRAGGMASPVVMEDAPESANTEAPIGPEEFAVCSFNLENLFDEVDDGDGDMGDWAPADHAVFDLSLEKRAAAIREDLQRCTIVGLEEVEGKDAVWQALAEAAGAGFRYDYYESADERDITNGILYDATRVTLRRSDLSQACTATDYGVNPIWSVGARSRANPCPEGSYPLFDRPPYIADLTVRSARGDRSLDLTVIVNHFKSKLGDEAVNRVQREAQSRHTASLLTGENAVALGDLNDPLGAETLAPFAGFVNLFEAHLPRSDRYTYMYNGQSAVYDHFITTAGLDRYFESGGPVHINADYPDPRQPDPSSRRSSDHDPVFVRFGFRPTGVSEALAGLVTGAALGAAGP
jgi:predicted extracellular nuclease